MKKFNTLLIANRGEIACRIIRTARSMGLATVAVYSEPDSDALHARLADSAYCVGPAAAGLSYLNQAEILRAARLAGAEAIHPGYGFLSENPEFARACAESGLVFVGPPPEVITSMGIKSRAREIMDQAGIPVIPGCRIGGSNQTESEELAGRIGYPLLIKADRGGGGKGIRLVTAGDELAEAIGAARRESAAAFGDGSLLMEKQVVGARHIEVQIFRDSHGNTVHLFERDCSLQRRHQKIIEEAPAVGLSPRLRGQLHTAAVAAAEAIGYLGAGTVEFLVSGDGQFYFLEINTRLQVEHPVTEMISGQDLVAWQLLVAAGERLPCTQDELVCSGAAIEVRIYAENPVRGFLPATGTISYLREPKMDQRVRVDSGVREGDVIAPHYDPLLAKLIVHGADRREAMARMRQCLARYQLAGVVTNVAFLQHLLDNETFLEGRHTISWVDEHLAELIAGQAEEPAMMALAALWLVKTSSRRGPKMPGDEYNSPWREASGFRLNQPAQLTCELVGTLGTARIDIFVTAEEYRLVLPEREYAATHVAIEGDQLSCRLSARNLTATVVQVDGRLNVFHGGHSVVYALADSMMADRHDAGGDNVLLAPIPGKVTAVLAEAGDSVRQGQPLLVVEAMKMEYVIRAPQNGRIGAMLFAEGASVRENDRLVELTGLGEDGHEAA